MIDTPASVIIYPPNNAAGGWDACFVALSLPSATLQDGNITPLNVRSEYRIDAPTLFFFGHPAGTALTLTWQLAALSPRLPMTNTVTLNIGDDIDAAVVRLGPTTATVGRQALADDPAFRSRYVAQATTQPGSAADPTDYTHWSLQPADTAYGKFESFVSDQTYSGNNESVWMLGYNASRAATSEPSANLFFHIDAEDTPGNRGTQIQLDLKTPDGTKNISAVKARLDRTDSTGKMTTIISHGYGASDLISLVGADDTLAYFQCSNNASATIFQQEIWFNVTAGTVNQMKIKDGSIEIYRACPMVWSFTGSKKLVSALNNAGVTVHDLIQYSSGDVLRLGDNNASRTLAIQFEMDKGTLNLNRGTTKLNVGIGGTSYGGGDGVMFVQNAATVPASNPTGGGVLYVEAGALKYRGSSGTVTVVGAA